jgi:hypothetical protein
MAAWAGWATGAWAGWQISDVVAPPVADEAPKFYRKVTPRRKGKRLPEHEDLVVEITEAFARAEEEIQMSTPVHDDGKEKRLAVLVAEITRLEKALMARRLDEEDAEMLLL